MADQEDAQVVDPGIDESVKKLTPEKIEKTILKVLNPRTSARLKICLETCMQAWPA